MLDRRVHAFTEGHTGSAPIMTVSREEVVKEQTDEMIADAARAFFGSRGWLDLYLSGWCPNPGEFPEYFGLRDAIVANERVTRIAPRWSWRWKLARWIVGM